MSSDFRFTPAFCFDTVSSISNFFKGRGYGDLPLTSTDFGDMYWPQFRRSLGLSWGQVTFHKNIWDRCNEELGNRKTHFFECFNEGIIRHIPESSITANNLLVRMAKAFSKIQVSGNSLTYHQILCSRGLCKEEPVSKKLDGRPIGLSLLKERPQPIIDLGDIYLIKYCQYRSLIRDVLISNKEITKNFDDLDEEIEREVLPLLPPSIVNPQCPIKEMSEQSSDSSDVQGSDINEQYLTKFLFYRLEVRDLIVSNKATALDQDEFNEEFNLGELSFLPESIADFKKIAVALGKFFLSKGVVDRPLVMEDFQEAYRLEFMPIQAVLHKEVGMSIHLANDSEIWYNCLGIVTKYGKNLPITAENLAHWYYILYLEPETSDFEPLVPVQKPKDPLMDEIHRVNIENIIDSIPLRRLPKRCVAEEMTNRLMSDLLGSTVDHLNQAFSIK